MCSEAWLRPRLFLIYWFEGMRFWIASPLRARNDRSVYSGRIVIARERSDRGDPVFIPRLRPYFFQNVGSNIISTV